MYFFSMETPPGSTEFSWSAYLLPYCRIVRSRTGAPQRPSFLIVTIRLGLASQSKDVQTVQFNDVASPT